MRWSDNKTNEATKSPTIQSTIAKHRKMLIQCNPATHNELHRYGSEPGKTEPEIVGTGCRNRYQTVLESSQQETICHLRGVKMNTIRFFSTAFQAWYYSDDGGLSWYVDE